MIREATADDMGALIAMARSFDATSQYGEWDGFNGTAVQGMLEAMLADDDSAIFVTDDLSAAIGFTVAPSLKSNAQMRIERFWWCDPAKRGNGMRLYHKADAWARERGAEIHSLVSPAKDLDVAALYRRLGYVPVETVWVKQ